MLGFTSRWLPVILVAAAIGVGSTFAAAADSASPRPIIIAHRGAHEEAPENTLAAFEKAIELHCDFVEVDVRPTSDGALVIMHDATLDRTTNGSGKVADHSLAGIRSLKIKDANQAVTSHQVPTFDEALAVCQGKIGVYVDHKGGSPADIVTALEKHEMLQSSIIYAPADRLRQFKRLKPMLRGIMGHPADPAEIARLAKELQPLCVDGHHLQWSREQVEAAHQAGAPVWVDVVGPFDNPVGYSWAMRLGVDAIQTNHPAACLNWRAGRQP